VSGIEPHLTEAPSHHPRWFGDLAIVAVGLGIVALIASTLSWCDFSVKAYRLAAAVPVLLCPGGPKAGELAKGSLVRVSAVYSGKFGQFSEVSSGNDTGWASGLSVDSATGVTTAKIFGLPTVTDPAFDGPDCTSTAPTTTVAPTTAPTTSVPETTVATTVAGTTAPKTPTTVGRTTNPRPTVRPTTAPTAPTTTATTLPTTSTTADTEGPDVGPVRLQPSTIVEQTVSVGATCPGTNVAQLTVSVSDPSGVKSVTYHATARALEEDGALSNVDEVYSSTVGPFSNAFTANDKATSAVIAVEIIATDNKGNVTTAVGSGILLRCAPAATTTTSTTLPATTSTTLFIP